MPFSFSKEKIKLILAGLIPPLMIGLFAWGAWFFSARKIISQGFIRQEFYIVFVVLMFFVFLRIFREKVYQLIFSVFLGLVLFTPAGHNPLVAALILGILFKSCLSRKEKLSSALSYAPWVLIPPGIILYGARNLNFLKFSQVSEIGGLGLGLWLLIFLVMLVYLATVIFLGCLFGVRRKTVYLTGIGSAVCGASAITITAPSIEAEPDDISVSLIAIVLVALFGMLFLLPFLAVNCGMTNQEYGVITGAILQFTGFVEGATQVGAIPDGLAKVLPDEIIQRKIALPVKGIRYLGLLIFLPLLGSVVRGRIYLPWYLWGFLGAGLIFSFWYKFDPELVEYLSIVYLTPIYKLFWASALAAIGLNTKIEAVFSRLGLQILVISFIAMLTALVAYFFGWGILFYLSQQSFI